jgi:hypothetical protein
MRVAVDMVTVLNAGVSEPLMSLASTALVIDDQIELRMAFGRHLAEEVFDSGLLVDDNYAGLEAVA